MVLEGAHREIHRVVAAGAGGPEPWRRRKLSEAHDLLALAQVSGRVEILSLDLRQNFRAMLALRVPVPCRRGGVGPFTVAPTAVLGLQYRPEAMVAAQPGTSFIEILERGMFTVHAALDHWASKEHRRGGAMIGTAACILADAATELAECHGEDTAIKLAGLQVGVKRLDACGDLIDEVSVPAL